MSHAAFFTARVSSCSNFAFGKLQSFDFIASRGFNNLVELENLASETFNEFAAKEIFSRWKAFGFQDLNQLSQRLLPLKDVVMKLKTSYERTKKKKEKEEKARKKKASGRRSRVGDSCSDL